MKKQMIHLYGASGSGTSTIGRSLCERLGYFFMDTDDYYWETTEPPYTVKRNISDRLVRIKRDIEEHSCVVVSGSFAGWGDELIPQLTLAIRVNTDTELRMNRLAWRERERFGERIAEGGDLYEHHQIFMSWAASYDDGGLDMRSRQRHDEWQKKLTCRSIEIDGSLPVEENLEIICRECSMLEGRDRKRGA